jgi:tetratricopeptide (TPR) repeat protein
MDKKKLSTASNSSSGAKVKQMPPPAKGKIGTKQASLTASASRSNTTATEVQSSEDFSSIQSYILFWLDSNIDMNDDNCLFTITQLQSVVNTVHVFNDSDQCANFLNKIKNQKVFMVVSGSLSQHTLPRIHNMPQLTAVFVFCDNRPKYESLTKSWSKVRGIFTDITVLCESVKQVARQCDEDSIDISLVSASDISDQSLDHLDQSFMYTQLIKEILFELKHDDDSVKKLVTYCRNKYSNNEKELKTIETFQNEYQLQSPIWWYTYECFIYHLLNWALRYQEFDVIIKMAFFIRDLHRHIEQLHKKQSKDFPNEFTVHRGQGMSPEMFEKMKKTKGGLISFNNFLSTSIKESVAMVFVGRALEDPTSVGVLFIITVNPSISSAPFASLDEVSYYKTLEKEILFSMHTVFRIGDIKQSNINNRVWHVHLTLTSDSDQQLNSLIERMRVEIEGPSPLYRLGALMIKVGEFIKAEEIYKALQERTTDELENANLYYQLGYINDNKGNYDKALTFYQRALTSYLKHYSPEHPNVATCYNNIGLVYDNKNDYRQALSFYEKAFKIYQKTLSDDHPNVATSYNSIGLVYNSMGDYTQALSFCKKALDIFGKSLPSTHPMLATSHNNIGLVYANMKKYSEAISSYKRAVEIGQQTLPPNHPNLQVYKQNLESVRKKGNT